MNNPKYVMRNEHKPTDVKEFVVNYSGMQYLIIYGKHINGGFIAVPSHGRSCEASEPEDVVYNRVNLTRCGFNQNAANMIAQVIHKFYKEG